MSFHCVLSLVLPIYFCAVCASPCKSISEIETALKLGVHLNANSINEMLKIAEVRQELCTNGALHQGSTVGLRINPLIGGGSIAALSTATATSKFGIPLTASTKPLILDLIRKYPYIQGLMCHVGSQVCFPLATDFGSSFDQACHVVYSCLCLRRVCRWN